MNEQVTGQSTEQSRASAAGESATNEGAVQRVTAPAGGAASTRPTRASKLNGMAARSARWQWRLTVAFAVMILIPSMYGFAGKFIELVHVFRGEPGGAFAVAPIVNYLLASLGFLCMLAWASWNGMFHDVERPKFDMLEHEEQLDRVSPHASWNSR